MQRKRAPMWLPFAVAACTASTDPSGQPSASKLPGEVPRQTMIIGDPLVFQALLPAPREGLPLEPFVGLRITVPDSSFAIRWWPTTIHVETDAGWRDSVQLRPTACLLPGNRGGVEGARFPFSFSWWMCDEVGVNTDALLSSDAVRQMADAVGGELLFSRAFKSAPGGSYVFRTAFGIAATATAVERSAKFNHVTAAYRLPNEPICVLSDIVPPPPCDPWRLHGFLPAVMDRTSAGGDTITLRRGGWVRASYRQSDGTMRTYSLDVK